MRIEIQHGAIIADGDGGLWRVLRVTDEGLFLLMFPERKDILHTRNVTWRQFVECGYEWKFP
jgi:hypothetical protein